MIVLFTDFGVNGPYVGQMRNVLYRLAPGIPVVELFSNAPGFNPRASAYLLPAYVDEFPMDSVFLCVVDPGVGSEERQPVVVNAHRRWFVGPDNGLFNVIGNRCKDAQWWRITWRPQILSDSFHGRDLFAPVAAGIANGTSTPPGDRYTPMKRESNDWPEDLQECIFIDAYGNVMTGQRADRVDGNAAMVVNDHELGRRRTFSQVPVGQAFWYKNANGLVEFAVNQGHAAHQLGIHIGSKFEIKD